MLHRAISYNMKFLRYAPIEWKLCSTRISHKVAFIDLACRITQSASHQSQLT